VVGVLVGVGIGLKVRGLGLGGGAMIGFIAGIVLGALAGQGVRPANIEFRKFK